MTEKENNRFDETIRSILDGKTEEVPGYIWESVEKRLPRKAKRIIPLPLKIFISTAAAAAVLKRSRRRRGLPLQCRDMMVSQ